MIGGSATIVIGIILLIAAVAVVVYRNTVMKAPIPIITLALVMVLGLGVISHDQNQVVEKAHNDCVSRVERSEGNRVMWVAVIAELGKKGNADGARVLTELLDTNLPLLQLKDCP